MLCCVKRKLCIVGVGDKGGGSGTMYSVITVLLPQSWIVYWYR